MSDGGNLAAIQRHYAERDARLWRCNTGALLDERGVPVRFGLANDTKQLNEKLKCGDGIGWQTRLVTPDMVGTFIAQFLSIEVKRDGWVFPNPTNKEAYAHAVAQRRWARLVRDEGGIAGFMIDPTRGFEPEGC